MINKVTYNKKTGNFTSVSYISNEGKEILKQLNETKRRKKKKRHLKLNIFF